MKKFNLRSLIVALVITLTANIAISSSAHAWLIFLEASGIPFTEQFDKTRMKGPSSTREQVARVALCVVLLPFCILNEQSNGDEGLSKADLVANGYTPEQAEEILKDPVAFAEKVKGNKVGTEITDATSKVDIAAQVAAASKEVVAPSVSVTSVD